MFKLQRGAPLYRVTNTLTGGAHPRGGSRPKLVCWVTRRGRSVTRVTGLARGELLRTLRRGEVWGWKPSAW